MAPSARTLFQGTHMNPTSSKHSALPSRRDILGIMAASLGCGPAFAGSAKAPLRIATFTADVTPPLGHALMGGGIAPAKEIVDPLSARGFVLLGAGGPIVLAAVDWCEIRNDAYERWREVLAGAAGTEPSRVIVTSLHQHDTPIADLTAQRLLDERGAGGSICDLEFHERAVQGVAAALRVGLKETRTVTHCGIGQARVENVASNRRYIGPDGRPRFNRMSATRDPAIREQPEGAIDPWLKTLSFWDVDRPVLALTGYATHPMSYYGQGGVSPDFVGLARRRRQDANPEVFQIYVSGCSGNVTAGKYNDGSPPNRLTLTERIDRAMSAAWESTARYPLDQVAYRVVRLRLEPRDGAGFTVEDLEKRLATDPKPFGQRVRPDSFVLTMGYGESATGYIPTEKHFEEDDGNLHDWCWVAPGCESRMSQAIRAALQGPR
jgi:hypothetical protein